MIENRLGNSINKGDTTHKRKREKKLHIETDICSLPKEMRELKSVYFALTLQTSLVT